MKIAFKDMKLQHKLLVTFLGMLIISLLVVGGFLLFKSFSLQNESALRENTVLAKQYAENIKLELSKALNSARSLAQLFEAYERIPVLQRRTTFNAFLRTMLEKNQDYLAVWTVWEPNALDSLDSQFIHSIDSSDKGRYTSSYYYADGKITQEKTTEEAMLNEDYYTIPKQLNREVILEPYMYSYSPNEPEILETSLIVPIRQKGNYLGSVGIDISLESYARIMEKVRPYGNGYAFLLSHNGTLVTHIRKEFVGKKYSDVFPEDRNASLVEKNASEGLSSSFTMKDKESGQSFLYIQVPVSIGETSTPWSVVIGVPISAIQKPIRSMFQFSAIIGFITLLLGIILSLFLSAQLTKPITTSIAFANKIATGDLTDKLEAGSHDETGKLAEALRTMAENLRSLIEKIRNSSENVNMMSLQVSRNSQQLSAGAQKQASSLEETSASMEETSASVKQLTSQVQSQAMKFEHVNSSMNRLISLALEVAQMATQVRKASDDSKDMTLKVASSSGKTLEVINRVKESSDQIANIVSVISDIADQTNLLALNASIEAARAGEAGRGFAVVAKEISKLADKSAEATKQIEQLIMESSYNVKEGVSSVQDVHEAINSLHQTAEKTEQFSEKMMKVADEQSAASQQVEEAVKSVTLSAQTMASALEQQSATVESMSATINDLSGVTQESATNAEQLSEAAVELAEEAKKMKALIEMFRVS
jgi:methyl-accepting chemotaxis protein